MVKNSCDFILDQSQFKGTNYFSNKTKILDKPWFRTCNKKREMICLISRLRTGHTCCSSHLTNKNIKSDRGCECGWHDQNLDHIFFDCSLYFDNACKLWIDICKVKPDADKNVVALAFSGDWKVYKLLFDFVVCNNLVI